MQRSSCTGPEAPPLLAGFQDARRRYETHDATGETGHRQSDSDVSPVNYKVTSLTGYVYWYSGGINVMAATLRMELRPALRDGTHLWHH